VGGAPTYRAEPFRVAVLGSNEITGLTRYSSVDGIPFNFLHGSEAAVVAVMVMI